MNTERMHEIVDQIALLTEELGDMDQDYENAVELGEKDYAGHVWVERIRISAELSELRNEMNRLMY